MCTKNESDLLIYLFNEAIRKVRSKKALYSFLSGWLQLGDGFIVSH